MARTGKAEGRRTCAGRMDMGLPQRTMGRGTEMHATRGRVGACGDAAHLAEEGALSRLRRIEGDTSTIRGNLCS